MLFIVLSGCQSIGFIGQNNKQAPIDDISAPIVVEQPPKIIVTDWKTILTPLVNELLQTAEVTENNRILISDIKNASNRYVSSTQINNVIFNLLSDQDIFSIIDKQTINQAKQHLGISYDDASVSRSKMIALARNVKADYLLFTTVNQPPQFADTQANVSMELLLTKTGEIVWQLSSDQIVNSQSDE